MSLRIGIDLGGTKIEAVALDGSTEVARARLDTPKGEYDATLAAIVDLVANLEQRVPPVRRSSEGEGGNPGSGIPARATVGIGIPGTVSTATGLVKNANSTWLIGRPLQRDLEARLGRPVRLANDANCFAVSEAADGAASDAEVVFGVIAGTGVGGGIVVHGRLITGAGGTAGEWGHNPLPWPDAEDAAWPECYCGKRGCIETFLSGPALTADHARATGVRMEPAAIVGAAQHGDAVADATVRRYERRMARALASVINVLDPDVIVLGGGMSNIDRLYTNVPRLWSPYLFAAEQQRPEPNEPNEPDGSRLPAEARRANAGIPGPGGPPATRLVPARHGATSGVRGAAWLWPASPRRSRAM